MSRRNNGRVKQSGSNEERDSLAAKIKLTRMGAKKQPTYRLVIQEERSKRDGRFIENVGFYNPRTEPATIVINQDRVNHWLSVGARPTESVGQLLKSAGITDKYYHMRTTKIKASAGEGASAEKAAAAPSETSAVAPLEGDARPA
jgi:small subunit ribosomal protein S16